MTTIKDLDLVLLIDGLMGEVTPAYLHKAEQALRPNDGFKRLGNVEDYGMRLLWAASSLAKARALELTGRAGTADTSEQSDELKREAQYLAELAQIMDLLFYVQARRDLGVTCGLALLRGWVIGEDRPNPLSALFGGLLG